MICWIAERWPKERAGCDGALIRAHLIPKQRIKRERDSALARPRRGEVLTAAGLRLIQATEGEVLWDERVWVPMCGGPTGIGGHHGRLDGGHIRLRREDLPAALEAFAEEYGLGWSLDRDYGPKET